jgi:RNase H-fold protein (predicted Holliday junction resolvase)
MYRPDPEVQRTLALYPSANAIGFSVFEGSLSPIDFGMRVVKEQKNKKSLQYIHALLIEYTPDIVVVDDYMDEGCRRSERTELLIETIVGIAHGKTITTRVYSRLQIRECFARFGAVNKDEIAHEIAKQFPEFAPRLPQKRKPARAEDPRMAIFDATALIFAYQFFEKKKRRGI